MKKGKEVVRQNDNEDDEELIGVTNMKKRHKKDKKKDKKKKHKKHKKDPFAEVEGTRKSQRKIDAQIKEQEEIMKQIEKDKAGNEQEEEEE